MADYYFFLINLSTNTLNLNQISRVIAIPIFHAAAAPSTHVGALAGGDTVYMMRRFDLQLFLQTTEKYRVTEMAMVPPIVLAIVMSPFARTRPFLKSVRFATCGAAPLDKDLQARLLQLMSDGAAFTQVWGMTETSCIATMFPYDEWDDTGSVGRLIPNLQLKYFESIFTSINYQLTVYLLGLLTTMETRCSSTGPAGSYVYAVQR